MNKTTRAQRRIVAKQVKSAREMDDKEFLKFAKKVLAKGVRPEPKRIGLMVKFPYDLRGSLDAKIKDCVGGVRWTAFMNNAGTLCHVISPEGEILIRLKFTYPIKHLSNWNMTQTVRTRVENYIRID